MSALRQEEIKRWTARRKAALILEIIQGKTTVAEASRNFDLTHSEIQCWIDQGKAGMQNALKAKPEHVGDQYGKQLKSLQGAYGEAMLELRARKHFAVSVGQSGDMIATVQQRLKDDGYEVSISKLCQWFGVARRSVYYKPTKVTAVVKPELAGAIKAIIEEKPSLGYRTVARLLDMNKNTVQRIFKIKGWQVRKRAVG